MAKGFEEMAWLFACDNRNRHIIRMNFDEAALVWWAVKQTEGDILEIGRYQGGTTVLLCAAGGDRFVYSIDILPREDFPTKEYLKVEMELNRLGFITGDSKEVTLPGPIGFALIDGDHSYAGVKADVEKHWPQLQSSNECRPLVAFHDAVPNSGLEHEDGINHCSGVHRYCRELVVTGVAKHVKSAGSVMVLSKLRELHA